MPPGPLVKSTRVRSLLVTLVLIAALLAAFLAAWLFTRSRNIQWRPVDLGEIHLTVPQQWKLTRAEARSPGVLPLSSFLASQSPEHRLNVGQIRENAFRAPAVALREAVSDVAGPSAAASIQDNLIDRLRSDDGNYVIAWTAAQRLDQPAWMVIAVLTRDGRNYWAIDLTSPFDEADPDVYNALSSYQMLFEQICRSTTPAQSSALTRSDITFAELAADGQSWQPPAGFATLFPANDLPGAPITLSPPAHQPYLTVMRVRGTLDADIDDPDHPLFPARLLEREHLSLTGQSTPTKPIERKQVAGRSVWTIATESRLDAASPTNFVRILAFVRLGAGRAMLVETFLEPALLPQYSAWLATIIRSAPSAPSATSSPLARTSFDPSHADSPINEALSRGRRLAARQRQSLLDSDDQPTSYELIADQTDSITHYPAATRQAADALADPVAYAVNLAQKSSSENDWPIQGRSLRTFPDGQTFLLDDRQWKLGPLGQRFVQQVQIQRRHPTLPVAQNLQHYRYEINGNHLNLYRALGAERTSVRTMNLPQEHVLPPAMQRWDVSLLRQWGDQPALAWLFVGEYPVACSIRWVERYQTDPDGTDPQTSSTSTISHSYLLIRPLVHTQSDVYRLTTTGTVTDRWMVRRPTGRLRHTRTVDRLTLLAAFPNAAIPFAAQ